ncbi:MAG: outer membrane protein assembly factor BamD [Myxococcales bacterium]
MNQAPKRLLEGGGEGSQAAGLYRLLSQLPKDAQDPEAVEERWKRNVWRRLSRKKRSPRLAWLAPATAVAAVLLWLRLPAPPAPHPNGLAPLARLGEAVGQVEAGEPARDWQQAHQGQALSRRSRLRTDPASHATLEIAGIAQVLLSPGSELSIGDLGPETFLELTKGGVLAHVTKRPPGQSFSVVLHGYRVRVVGTIFSVSEGSGGSVLVQVTEGVVRVERGDGRSWRVAAGESWSSAAVERAPASGESAAPAVAPPGSAAPGPAPARSASARPEDHEVEPPPLPRRLTSSKESAAQAFPSAIPNLLPPAPAPPPIPSPTAVPPVVLAPDRPPAPPAPASLPASAPPAAALAPSGSPPPDLYAQAARLSASGRYADAAKALQSLIENGGAHSDLALYELGRLRQLHLGDLPGAIELFDEYRSRYPHGALEQEAGLSIIEAELARGKLGRARPEMDRFLTEHPESERAEEVHLLRGNVLRESRQCAAAIADYRLCKDPKLGDDALYFTAWCEKRLGRAQAAEGSLRSYLKRFPAGRHLDDVRQALQPAE